MTHDIETRDVIIADLSTRLANDRVQIDRACAILKYDYWKAYPMELCELATAAVKTINELRDALALVTRRSNPGMECQPEHALNAVEGTVGRLEYLHEEIKRLRVEVARLETRRTWDQERAAVVEYLRVGNYTMAARHIEVGDHWKEGATP